MKAHTLRGSLRVTHAVLLVVVGGLLVAQPARAATYSVTNTNDSGAGSLRQAIVDANANSGWDRIEFAIGFVGSFQTISLSTPLPVVTDTVSIEGWSQGGLGYSGPPLIELDGSGAGAGANGLTITAGGSNVVGLVVNRFSQNGLLLYTGGGNYVEGCYLGTNSNGTTDLGNAWAGIRVDDSPNNTIGGTTAASRNVISGNDQYGVEIIRGNANSNVVIGNYIGTDASGTAAIGNGDAGILIWDSASLNSIGGYSPGEGNVISGNGISGINIAGTGASFCEIEGNYIGTNASGTAALANGADGVRISGAGYTAIGGTHPGSRNVISGNMDDGIEISGSSAVGNQVFGNYIGTNVSGMAALPNGYGVYVNDGSSTLIGGSNSAARNVISGNVHDGVRIYGSSATLNHIRGNYIGTDVVGTAGVPNQQHGVYTILTGSNTVGGTIAGEGNVIAYNTECGVCVYSGGPIQIRRNSLKSNGTLGIDLGEDGVTGNDYQDPDTGANGLQNFPLLTSVTCTAGTTTVQGTLNSTPSRNFTIELFYSSAADPSGYGEGATWFGSKSVFTNPSTGSVSFSETYPVTIPNGYYVTATAFDQTAYNTSEFSQAEYVVNTDMVLTVSISGGSAVLNWTTATGAVEYWVYAALNWTYFPPLISLRQAILGPGTTTWSSAAGVGDPSSYYTYMVLAVDGGGSEIARSNRAGEFDFSSVTLR